MAQSVWGYPALDACRTDGGGEGTRQHTVIERRVTGVVGEQPAAVVMGPPQASQLVENRLWQRHEPLLVAPRLRRGKLLPTIRNTWLARSTAPISSVVASLMRRPQAYMTARQVLWVGLRIPLSRRRT
jgi:hypothetical protein